MSFGGGRVQRQGGVVVVERRRRQPGAKLGRQLGERVRCTYCGAIIVLGYMRVGERRRFRRAVDLVRVPPLTVPPLARFVLVRSGRLYKPARGARVVNPWHLFTCRKQPADIAEKRDRALARYVAGVEAVLRTGE